MLHSHFAGERHSEDLLVGRERGIPPAFATYGHMNGWWTPCSNTYWKNICYKTHWKMNLNDGHWLFWLSGKLGGTFDKTKWRLLDRANMNHCNISVVLEFFCILYIITKMKMVANISLDWWLVQNISGLAAYCEITTYNIALTIHIIAWY